MAMERGRSGVVCVAAVCFNEKWFLDGCMGRWVGCSSPPLFFSFFFTGAPTASSSTQLFSPTPPTISHPPSHSHPRPGCSSGRTSTAHTHIKSKCVVRLLHYSGVPLPSSTPTPYAAHIPIRKTKNRKIPHTHSHTHNRTKQKGEHLIARPYYSPTHYRNGV